MATTHFEGPVESVQGYDGPVGAVTPAAGTFTTLTASGVVSLTNASISMTALPTSNPGANRLWMDTAASRVIKVGT